MRIVFRTIVIICLVVAGAVALLVRYESFLSEIPKEVPRGKEHVGVVVSDPKRLDGKSKGFVQLKEVKVRLSSYTPFVYGDKVSFSCNFREAEGAYYWYLLKNEAAAGCSAYTLQALESRKGNPWYHQLLDARDFIMQRLREHIAFQQANLTIGVLVGGMNGFNQELLDQFRKTGVTHIVAVSGYNVTLIVVIIWNLLSRVLSNRWLIIIPTLIFFFATAPTTVPFFRLLACSRP